jgi:hypothetical protein
MDFYQYFLKQIKNDYENKIKELSVIPPIKPTKVISDDQNV